MRPLNRRHVHASGNCVSLQSVRRLSTAGCCSHCDRCWRNMYITNNKTAPKFTEQFPSHVAGHLEWKLRKFSFYTGCTKKCYIRCCTYIPVIEESTRTFLLQVPRTRHRRKYLFVEKNHCRRLLAMWWFCEISTCGGPSESARVTWLGRTGEKRASLVHDCRHCQKIQTLLILYVWRMVARQFCDICIWGLLLIKLTAQKNKSTEVGQTAWPVFHSLSLGPPLEFRCSSLDEKVLERKNFSSAGLLRAVSSKDVGWTQSNFLMTLMCVCSLCISLVCSLRSNPYKKEKVSTLWGFAVDYPLPSTTEQ